MTSDNVINELDRDEINSTLQGIAGAPILYELDDRMIAAYCELMNVELRVDAMLRDCTKRHFQRSVGKLIDDDVIFDDPQSGLQRVIDEQLFENESEAITVFQLMAQWEELRASFWYNVRLQFNVWNYYLEVRKGFRIVSLGKKFTGG